MFMTAPNSRRSGCLGGGGLPTRVRVAVQDDGVALARLLVLGFVLSHRRRAQHELLLEEILDVSHLAR